MDDILNFYQSSSLIGTAGQPTREQFGLIAGQSYSAVINLAMPDSDNAIADEGALVTALGMTYIHLPVPFEAPSAQHVGRFFRVMNALEGNRVFVHCALNARVSAFMYKYLTLQKGASPEESTSPLLAQWLPRMDQAWQSILELDRNDIEA